MSPSGDMPDLSSQQESFSLANIIPQSPCNNEVIWEQIESAVRGYVSAGNEVFVVTGPIYEGQTIATIGNGVAVPTRIFKAIYNPQTGEAIKIKAKTVVRLRAAKAFKDSVLK